MKCNVGKTDKIIRFILALAGLILGFVYNPWFYLIFVGGVVSASTGFCPLYKVLGVSTCDVDHSEAHAESAPVENFSESGNTEVVEEDKSQE